MAADKARPLLNRDSCSVRGEQDRVRPGWPQGARCSRATTTTTTTTALAKQGTAGSGKVALAPAFGGGVTLPEPWARGSRASLELAAKEGGAPSRCPEQVP